MNATTLKALLLDAFYQVLDNKIFRVLLVLDLFFVAVTFVIGFRPDEIRVLFGAWTLSYDSFLQFAGGNRGSLSVDVQGSVVQGIQSFVVENLCGQLGMVVCLSATAFFIPRMLEKGAADIVFAKPVSRFALFLSRYFAGLLFVGILSLLLVVGMWLGFLVSSGYGDAGFLWGAVTLIYLFAILHAVSMAIGTFTRSTVAAILFSVVFFVGTGCVHRIWTGAEYASSLRRAERARGETETDPALPRDSKSAPAVDEELPPLLRVLGFFLDATHYVLPKTTDADVITRKLRRAIEGPGDRLTDDAVHVALTKTPEDFVRVAPARGEHDVDLSSTDARWVAHDARGGEVAWIEVRRFPRTASEGDGKSKPKRMNTAQAAEHVLQRERAAGRLAGEVKQEKTYVDRTFAQTARWKDGARERSEHVLTLGEWVFEISESAESSWLTPEERATRFESFHAGVELSPRSKLDPNEWYESRFAWKAPMKFNVGFSIASTLLFTLLLLAIANWKLSRTDF